MSSVVPELAASGMIGAILIADAFQLGQRAEDGAARGLVMLFVPLICGSIGAALHRLESRGARLAAALGITAIGSLALAGTLFLAVWPQGLPLLMGGVALALLGLLPVLAILFVLHERTRTVRPRSLLSAAYERTSSLALAGFACAGALVVSILPENPMLWQRSLSASAGVLGLVLLPLFAIRNVTALRSVRRLAATAGEMRRVTEVAPTEVVLDLGIGDDVQVDRVPGGYRGAPATRTVIGSAREAAALVRREAVLAAVVAIVLVGLAIARGVYR